jgi:hypothetical protein
MRVPLLRAAEFRNPPTRAGCRPSAVFRQTGRPMAARGSHGDTRTVRRRRPGRPRQRGQHDCGHRRTGFFATGAGGGRDSEHPDRRRRGARPHDLFCRRRQLSHPRHQSRGNIDTIACDGDPNTLYAQVMALDAARNLRGERLIRRASRSSPQRLAWSACGRHAAVDSTGQRGPQNAF